jgi:protein deglycase
MDGLSKKIAAICVAPSVLMDAEIMGIRYIISPPSVQNDLQSINNKDNRVVVGWHIVTSKSPGTKMELALKLVKIIFGREKRDVVNEGVLAKV